ERKTPLRCQAARGVTEASVLLQDVRDLAGDAVAATAWSDTFFRNRAEELGSGHCDVAKVTAPKHRDNQLILHDFGFRKDLFKFGGFWIVGKVPCSSFFVWCLAGPLNKPPRQPRREKKIAPATARKARHGRSWAGERGEASGASY